MTSIFNPLNLDPDETLGRRISSSRYLSKLEKQNVPYPLLYEKDTHILSVDRLNDSWQDDVLAIAIDYFEHHHPDSPRKFYGWVEVSQPVALQSEREVTPSPEPRNKYHADIAFPEKAKADSTERTKHAMELAAHAVWRPSPA